MTPSLFVAILEKAMPAAKKLRTFGLGVEEINDIQRTFKAVKRPRAHLTQCRNELDELLVEYDCSSVAIGPITFLEVPVVSEYGTMIGHCEADPIVVLDDGTVVMCDHEKLSHQLVCAANSGHFLDALAEFVRIVKDRKSWERRSIEAADACARLAGGEKCRPFFQSICGFL